MVPEARLLDWLHMAQEYGHLLSLRQPQPLDKTHVPPELWPLIPYAEFWGVADDVEREKLVRSAPCAVLKNLTWAIRTFDNALDVWLAGAEAVSLQPSKEYIAFSAMRMAADFA